MKNRNAWYTRAPQLPIIIGIDPMAILLIIQVNLIIIAMHVTKLQLVIPVIDIGLSLIAVEAMESGIMMISMDYH